MVSQHNCTNINNISNPCLQSDEKKQFIPIRSFFNMINFYKRSTTFNTLCHDFIRNIWIRRKHTKNMNQKIPFRNPKMWRLPKISNLSYPLWVVFNPLCWPNEKKAALAHTCDMKTHSNIMLQPYGVTHPNLWATIFLMGVQLYLYHECPPSLVLDLLFFFFGQVFWICLHRLDLK